MDMAFLLARVIHIVTGVFWAGALIFTAFFLLPAIREAGPDGAKVAAGLIRRGFLTIMPLVALLSILSGAWLYWKASVGFQPAYMGSRPGMGYGLGAVTALLAFGIGVTIVRPSMLRAAALAQAAASAPADREARMAEAQALRMRAGKAGAVVAVLLVFTALVMALARYL